jgi:hypothetical protein
MSVQDVVEVFKGSGDKIAMIGGRDKAYVINDRGSDEVGEPATMTAEDVRQGCDKEEGAEGVALSHPLVEGVRNYIVHAKRYRRISGKVHTWGRVVEETKPGCERRAVKELDRIPDISPEDVVECFFQIARDKCTSSRGSSLGRFNELFAAPGDSNTKVKQRDEVALACVWQGFSHHHIGSYADKSFSNSEVAQLDDRLVGVLVEEGSFELSGPMSQPGELAACKVFNEGNENSPVRVFMVVVLLGDGEASE